MRSCSMHRMRVTYYGRGVIYLSQESIYILAGMIILGSILLWIAISVHSINKNTKEFIVSMYRLIEITKAKDEDYAD